MIGYQAKGLRVPPCGSQPCLVSQKIWFLHQDEKVEGFPQGDWFSTINFDGTFEVDVKIVDLNSFIGGESPKHREKVYFIRIGILNVSSPRKLSCRRIHLMVG
jgi:hypothetical protein